MFEKLKRGDPLLAAYDEEERKLHECLAKLTAGTTAYAEAQCQLEKTNKMRQDHNASKGRMGPGEKASLWRKILGGGITLGGAFMLGRYESKGMMFTGEKKSLMDGFTRVLAKMFGGGD